METMRPIAKIAIAAAFAGSMVIGMQSRAMDMVPDTTAL